MLRILNEAATMAGEYSLADVLERMYENQLALEAALMELTLQSETQIADSRPLHHGQLACHYRACSLV